MQKPGSVVGAQTGSGAESAGTVLAIVLDHYVGVSEGIDSLSRLCGTSGLSLIVWSPHGVIPHELREPFSIAVGGCRFRDALPDSPAQFLRYQAVYVPIAMTGLVYGLVHGDDRDPVVRTILMAVYLGIPVALLGIGFNPAHRAWDVSGLGRAQAIWPDEWRTQTKRLRGLGVDVLKDPLDALGWVHERLGGPKLLDVGMVEMFHVRGINEVMVGVSTVITPGAQDHLRHYGMKIKIGGGLR